MGKYNDSLNDNYLLATNLLGMMDYKSLEEAEAFILPLSNLKFIPSCF